MGITISRLASTAGLALCLAAPPVSFAQSTPPQTTEDALRALTDAAGVVFSGTVTAVRRPAERGGIVEIDFAVADALRGVSSSNYTLREWAGLWQANDEPFRPGQRYLMLLHTPNAAGLSSPVGGSDGAIPIQGSGLAAASSATTVSPRIAATHGTAITQSASAGAATVDLGWIATRVAVAITYREGVTARPVTSPGLHAQALAGASADSSGLSLAQPVASSSDDRTRPYSTVIEMLRTWEANHDSSR